LWNISHFFKETFTNQMKYSIIVLKLKKCPLSFFMPSVASLKDGGALRVDVRQINLGIKER